ncbi:MAG: pimeloyl-ACP methyl ester esterase BioH [Nitrosomonadales bacterium]|nr:pimeloyl-ACP methyl ester esterase BioH [Nitrosomonadales bacterium]
MSLHVESAGSGKPLLLIHGWGMHGGVWTDVAQKLATDFRVHSVDLPGFGASAPLRQTNLDAVVQALSQQFSEPLNVCGWSLGGQFALHWAKGEPEKVRRLVLVTSTPCFAGREDWLFGMAIEVLAKFAAELEQNHAATLRRFIALQLRGSENERELLGLLRERLFSRGEPDMGALRGGLEILRDADLRATLPEITQPTLLIAGERDRLTPPEASYYLAQTMPSARVVEVAGAAHAPFLSHPDIFVEQVKSFLNE